MKCQILFSGKNKKNIINLSSAENAQRVVKVNLHFCDTMAVWFLYTYFLRSLFDVGMALTRCSSSASAFNIDCTLTTTLPSLNVGPLGAFLLLLVAEIK